MTDEAMRGPFASLRLQASALFDEVTADPLFRDFARQVVVSSRDLTSDRMLRTDTPFMVLGERAMYTAVLLEGRAEGMPPDAQRVIGLVLNRATPYLWRSVPLREVFETALPPHDVPDEILPEPVMWMSFENGVTMAASEADGTYIEDVSVDGMLLFSRAGGIDVISIGIGETAPRVTGSRVALGGRWPDDYATVAPEGLPVTATNMAGFIIAAASFLASPFIPKEAQRIDRKHRRSLGRSGSKRADDIVTCIDLRPAFAEHREVDPTGRHVTVRFVVRGHHKMQPYGPARSLRRLTWIAPHVKGPPDAPMRERVYRVVR